MKMVVLGAAGVIGQHMRLDIPAGVKPVFVRRKEDLLHRGLELEDFGAVREFLERERPDAIVNLAGESRPDVVELAPGVTERVNVGLPGMLATWCAGTSTHYVHVSTQAVFSGKYPPYPWSTGRNPANLYGHQKHCAEIAVQAQCECGWTIVRPTFVLGVRPIPSQGRLNPIEQMLGPGEQRQVEDRWFSVSFAEDVARELWRIAIGPARKEIIHLGAGHWSRYEIAKRVKRFVTPVRHADFVGIAPRPLDTTYEGVEDPREFEDQLGRCVEAFEARWEFRLIQRAREISLFTGIPAAVCLLKLQRGFPVLHGAVAEDFRLTNPVTDAEVLEWYRSTEAYIWELSAYHRNPAFNYAGMCAGVASRLIAVGARQVLCLGDGIGDLTLALRDAGLNAVYHDLAGSRTAAFAAMRYWMYHGGELPQACTRGWEPEIPADQFDAVCSFGFLEHVTDVPAWVGAIRRALKPGGLFFAQNAFACGSGPDGSIPMHLARNDRFERDWDPLLASIGFVQELSANWYARP